MSDEKKNRSAKVIASIIRNNNVNEGMTAFALWLNTKDKYVPTMPIVMKDFIQDKKVILQDNILRKDITVDIIEGIPFCNGCRSNECAHVGFAICAQEMKRPYKIE